MLTIVTAADRNPAGLAALHGQLAGLLGADLAWVIQDSGACAATRRWLATIDRRQIDFDASGDAGLYDALNRAVIRVRTPWYLVVGSDDSIDSTAIPRLLADLESAAGRLDILTYPVRVGTTIRRRRPWLPAQINVGALVASHSVGTVIRRDLHQRLGLYDTRYRVLADSLFLRRAQLGGARFGHHDAPVPGSFGTHGVSSRAFGRIITENYSYNIECGSSRWFQALMLLARLGFYRPRSLGPDP